MRNKGPIILLFLSATTAVIEMHFIDNPGTMDACYYFAGATSLSEGRGLSEDFLWNFLDDPTDIPHAGFSYWMPLPSLVASMGLVDEASSFRQMQIPILVLAVLFPLFVYFLGMRWTGNTRIAFTAGCFSIVPGFYSVYWLNLESFLLFAWIGGAFFFLVQEHIAQGKSILWSAILGIVCGLTHLARADGLLFLLLAILIILLSRRPSIRNILLHISFVFLGYFAICGFWYLRNIEVYGSVFPNGGLRSAWLVTYNDIFHYPATNLTLERFLSAGLSSILAVRWEAFLWNIQTLVFVLGLVFLGPFILVGGYRLRSSPSFRWGGVYLALLFFAMTILYPLQGSRGGFFHSSAAVLVLVSVAAAVGLERTIEWIGEKRNWGMPSAYAVLSGGIILFSLLSGAWIFSARVIGSDPSIPAWSRQAEIYPAVLQSLDLPTTQGTRYMVANPPCFHVQTGLEAVVVPDGTVDILFAAAGQYGVQYVLLDANAPYDLLPFFAGERTDPRLLRKGDCTVHGARFIAYQISPDKREQ